MSINVSVIIPHRDRGRDWRRTANLDTAVKRWELLGYTPLVVDDGRTGDAQFCRSAAYNRGISYLDWWDVLILAEADLLLPAWQIAAGIDLALEAPGLVVPFSQFMAMTDEHSVQVRSGLRHPSEADATQVRGDRQSIGAVNIVSRATLAAIGRYDEVFEGAWYDDDAMARAFAVATGTETRFVDGPGWHQYHLPGAATGTGIYADGSHLTDEDRAATENNLRRWKLYRAATTPERIRELTAGTLA